MPELEVMPGCEEFAFDGGPTGALLIHGFTGSPQGMRPMGEWLAEQGLAVVAPRLPGHGTTWQDLEKATPPDWVGAVDTSFDHLSANTERTFVVALSFGCALALDLTMRNPDRVAGLVLLAPFLMTKDPRRHLAPLITRFVRSVPGVGGSIADPDMKEIAYDRVPTKATLQMLRFIGDVKGRLSEVKTPTLIIHSPLDKVAHPDNARIVHDNIASSDKELVWLERSHHVVTLDLEREQIFERTLNFIKERSGGN